MKSFKRWWYHWRDPVVLKQSFFTSMLVGSILLMITLGNKLWRGSFGEVIAFKISLTYLVPYCVSSFTAVRTQLHLTPDQEVVRAGQYQCESCLHNGINHLETLDLNDRVPECEQFGSNTKFVFYRKKSWVFFTQTRFKLLPRTIQQSQMIYSSTLK